MKQYSDFEFKRLLVMNGYKYYRMASGDHVIYYNEEKTTILQSRRVVRRICAYVND